MINAHHAPGWLRFLGINYYGWRLFKRRFNSAFRRYQRFLKESQYWDPKQLEAYQLEHLSDLLKEAVKNVPFYGRHFAACGFTPSQFSNLNDLRRIEPVSKSQLREAGTECLHHHYKRFKPQFCYTSGTTGEKFAYYVPEELRFAFKAATIWRQYSWAGVKLLDRRVTLGGRYFASKPPYWVHNISENQLLLSIHHLNEITAGQYLDQMRRFKPVFIQGHPSGLDYLSRYLTEQEQTYPLKAVFSTGETMSNKQRANIESAFACKVFEEYGQGECVFVAQESQEHCGFHEVSEFGLIEFDSQKDGGLEQVLGTSLWNHAMPFIRYRVEDLVEPVSQSYKQVGRIGLPVKIKRVIGRTDESITNTMGQMVLPVTVRMIIKPLLKNSENYQLSQIGAKDYLFRLTGCRLGRDINEFKFVLLQLVGNDARVEVKIVDSLRSSGGKIRNVVNEYRTNNNAI
jgi:phenylacetate-CoA ligase